MKQAESSSTGANLYALTDLMKGHEATAGTPVNRRQLRTQVRTGNAYGELQLTCGPIFPTFAVSPFSPCKQTTQKRARERGTRVSFL